MGKWYESTVRPLLFRCDAERAHELGVHSMEWLARLAPLRVALERCMAGHLRTVRPVEVFGLSFPNAVGLAAGFDKDARAWPAAAALGFGHVEVGTVTALAQPGNPRPRAFRYA
ncbi:MAG: dihydroorotate dehydrogenase (quinone), partial [Opitutaceae bacterium]